MKSSLKILCVFLGLVLGSSVMLCGCSGDSDSKVLTTAISQIDMEANGHVEQLSDYDSPYTVCYKNKNDTYTLYIFASPIQYKTEIDRYAVIDNTVVESNENGFAFENKANNIKTYFPKTLSEPFRVEMGADFLEFAPNWNIDSFSEANQTVFTNMYGDKVSAVVYERKDMDLFFYPTKAGIKVEIVLKEKPDSNEFSFIVKSGAASYENKRNGYVLFKNGGRNESIIYQPLVQYTADKGQKLDVIAQMNINREEEDYLVTVAIDESIFDNAKTKYPVKLDPSFEMYLNKMPDSTVYSKHTVNNFLANYAVVGEHPAFGEGWHYVRYRLNFFFHANEEDIKSANYCVRNLYSSKDIATSLYRADAQWSSTGILWSDRIDGTELVSDTVKSKKEYGSYKINTYVQDCVGAFSWETESIGVLMKAEENSEGHQIFATSDHSLYSPYILINLTTLPTSFEKKDNINENMN
ncbi:MAG: hypothetical protein PHH84_05420 [Oscillospiraceae bacterium]|nr:hypothetical protein [Oscillospiraceae bacterium]MDD4414709.1 hypothetical protein [Oscillospiraceae bacterium]